MLRVENDPVLYFGLASDLELRFQDFRSRLSGPSESAPQGASHTPETWNLERETRWSKTSGPSQILFNGLTA